MRSNVVRDGRTAFDGAVAEYAAGRPAIPQPAVDRLLAVAGVGEDDSVLEVGAGTGQLTVGLRAAGVRVVALEPGPNMGAALRSRFDGDGNVTVVESFFEDFLPCEPFKAIASANAFHWVDSSVGYGKAADVLQAGGALALLWTYLTVRDPDVRALLRDRDLGGHFASFLPEDADEFMQGVQQTAAAGRRELRDTHRYVLRWWSFDRYDLTVGADRYTDLLFSFANAATVTREERDRIRHRVVAALRAAKLDRIEFDNCVYSLVAIRP